MMHPSNRTRRERSRLTAEDRQTALPSSGVRTWRLLLVLLVLACFSCGQGSTEEARPARIGQTSAQLQLTLQAFAESPVTSVVVDVEPAGVRAELQSMPGPSTFGATFELPTGKQKVIASAYAGPTLLGKGEATVDIQQGQTASAFLRIHSTSPQALVPDHGPLLQRLVIPRLTVWGGESLALEAGAVDPDGDPITFAWEDDCGGSFAPSTSSATTWRVPTSVATCHLTVTASAKDLSDRYTFTLVASSLPAGDLSVSVEYVFPTTVTSVSVAPCSFGRGQSSATCTTALRSGSTASVQITYETRRTAPAVTVRDNCGGALAGAAQIGTAQATIPWKLSTASAICLLTVSVADGTVLDEFPVAFRIAGADSTLPDTAPPAPTIQVNPAPGDYVTVARPKAAVASAPSAREFEWTIEGGEFTDAIGQNASPVARGASVFFQSNSPGTIKLSCVARNPKGASEASTSSIQAVVLPLAELSATPELLVQGGSTTLRANYADGTSARIVGGSAIASGGTVSVSPVADTRYTIEVKNVAGDSVTASVRVVVLPRPLDANFIKLSPPTSTFSLASKLTVPEHAAIGHWTSRPAMPATFGYPMQVTLTAAERASVAELKRGRFRPETIYPTIDSTIPPPWTDNPAFDQTYAFYTHALTWTMPLVKAWVLDGDAEALALFKTVVRSWITSNSTWPFVANQVWKDHPASFRTRMFCWFWALWQDNAATDPAFAELLLRSVYQHATYLASLDYYAARSNHAVHMDGSLLAAAITFPEFQEAGRWLTVANQRLAAYALRTFSETGFNLEQSPYYHWYALLELGESTTFMRRNGIAPLAELQLAMERGFAVFPYLIRPDRRVPNVGDSSGIVPDNWRTTAAEYLGSSLGPPAAGLPSPRASAGPFIVDFDSGYAIFAPNPDPAITPKDDTYLIARINSKPFTGHCHVDAGSFELFGLGRDWLVDSGKFSYDANDPARKYVTSARAHNVVLVDNENFGFHPIRMLAAKRTNEGDSVSIRHDLPKAYHTRGITLTSTKALRLADRMASRDGQARLYSQLLHVAPGLTVTIVSPREVKLTAANGSTATIRQNGPLGTWTAIKGQETPYFQGWYSNTHAVRTAITTLSYANPAAASTFEFDTEVTIAPRAP